MNEIRFPISPDNNPSSVSQSVLRKTTRWKGHLASVSHPIPLLCDRIQTYAFVLVTCPGKALARIPKPPPKSHRPAFPCEWPSRKSKSMLPTKGSGKKRQCSLPLHVERTNWGWKFFLRVCAEKFRSRHQPPDFTRLTYKRPSASSISASQVHFSVVCVHHNFFQFAIISSFWSSHHHRTTPPVSQHTFLFFVGCSVGRFDPRTISSSVQRISVPVLSCSNKYNLGSTPSSILCVSSWWPASSAVWKVHRFQVPRPKPGRFSYRLEECVCLWVCVFRYLLDQLTGFISEEEVKVPGSQRRE